MLYLERSKLYGPLAAPGELLGRVLSQVRAEAIPAPVVAGVLLRQSTSAAVATRVADLDRSQGQSTGGLVDGLPDLLLRLVAQALEQGRRPGEVRVGPDRALGR